MKRAFLAFWILWGFTRPMYALDVAFATNGVVVAVPVEMPVVGVRLDTGATVFNLLSADDATRNACGYYPLVRFDRTTLATNQYVAARIWTLDGGRCVESVTVSNRVPKITLSRVKVAALAKANGWATNLLDYIHGDPVVAVRWYSTEPLVAGSEEMRPFIEAFGAFVGLPYTNAVQLLEQCREDR